MTQKLKIVSDGTAVGTRVHAGGVELTDVVKIEIDKIEFGTVVKAKITFINVELDVVAELAK
jgi:hypothetical protein